LSASFERYFEVGGYEVRVRVGSNNWSIEMVSGGARLTFSASCETPKSCAWAHEALLILVGAIAPILGKPELAAEIYNFVQGMYKRSAEEGVRGEAVEIHL
jgi:hypothetical protein